MGVWGDRERLGVPNGAVSAKVCINPRLQSVARDGVVKHYQERGIKREITRKVHYMYHEGTRSQTVGLS